MKKILFRKLLLDYMSFFLIALTSASIIIWVFQAVNFLDIMIEDGRDYIVYINYSLLNFPKIFTRLFPFVLFFSLFYVTVKYENNNELIIYWNFGVNKFQIITFIFKISIILMISQIILTSFIVPKTQAVARNFIKDSSINFFGNFIKPQRFNDTIKGITIFTEKKDEKGNLYNLYLKKEINNDEFQITYAKKGVFKKINKIPVLILENGENINGKENEITNFSFSKSDFPLNKFQTNTTTYKKTQEISTPDLLRCLKSIYEINEKKFIHQTIENCSYKNLNNLYKELYKRIFIPLYIPVLMLLPFLLITSSKENLNYTKIKVSTFLIGLFIIIFSETTIRFITSVIINNFILSLIPLIIFLSLYSMFYKKFNLSLK